MFECLFPELVRETVPGFARLPRIKWGLEFKRRFGGKSQSGPTGHDPGHLT